MFSRLALQKGSSLWRPNALRCTGIWTFSAAGNKGLDHGEDTKTIIARWDKANKTYYGPDRDLKNYPTIRIDEHAPPTRLGVFPSSWFDAFYEKTGVTGPYMFMTGALTFLLSKEYLILDHNFAEFFAVYGAIFIFVRLFSDKTREAANKYTSDYMAKYWYDPIKETIEGAHSAAEKIKLNIQTQDAQKYVFEAKRENVDLQLEYAYRQRLAEVHQAVKRRLDYQVDKENAVKQFEQNHMVRWIIQNVMKSITPQQEKDTLTRCIQDLKAMSAARV